MSCDVEESTLAEDKAKERSKLVREPLGHSVTGF